MKQCARKKEEFAIDNRAASTKRAAARRKRRVAKPGRGKR
jgi:hypothetical protein